MNTVIELINTASSTWVRSAMISVLESMLLLGLIALIWMPVRNRVSPQIGYWLFPDSIRLEPWARVKGTFRVGQDVRGQIPISIDYSRFNSQEQDAPSISADEFQRTDSEGHFDFKHVFPGTVRIGRYLRFSVGEGSDEVFSSHMRPVTLIGGETNELNLGGTGQAVVGRFQAPGEFKDKVNWNYLELTLQPALAPIPEPQTPPIPPDIAKDPAKTAEWMVQWYQTDPGKAWLAWHAAILDRQRAAEAAPRTSATVGRDGAFRINDVPPGNYILSAYPHAPLPIHLTPIRITIPDREKAPSEETKEKTVDLGTLVFEALRQNMQ